MILLLLPHVMTFCEVVKVLSFASKVVNVIEGPTHMKLKYYILETILWSSFRGTTKMYLFSSNKLVEYYIFIHFKLIKFLMTWLLITKGSSNVQSRWDQPHPHTFLPPCTSNFCYLCDNCCEHTVHGWCCIFSFEVVDPPPEISLLSL
jgi:hypothetical protein